MLKKPLHGNKYHAKKLGREFAPVPASPASWQGDVIVWALNLVGVPAVAVISLDTFISLEEVGEDGIKNLDVRPLAYGVQSLNPDKVPPPDVDAQLFPQGGLASVLVGAKGVPLLHLPLLGDPKVDSIDRHQAVVADIVDGPSIKINLQFCKGGEQETRARWVRQ